MPSWGLGMKFRLSIFAALVTGAFALAHANGGLVTKINAIGYPSIENSVTEVLALEGSPRSVRSAKQAMTKNPTVTVNPIVIEVPVLQLPQTNNLVE